MLASALRAAAAMNIFALIFALLIAIPAGAQPAPPPLGAPLADNQAAIESLGTPPADMDAALARLRTDLAKEQVTGFDGRTTNLMAKLDLLPETVLSSAQKGRVMNALAEIYEMNLRLEASIPAGAPGKGYQMVNWQHTRTEVNEILDGMLEHNAAAAGQGRPLLTSTQLEDAMLAAAFSDSVKLPPGATGNFFRHHLDGAAAARKVVERYYPGDTARVDGIVNAIREHQIVPPEFMGNLARHAMVGKQKGELTAAFKRAFPGEDPAALKPVLDQLDRATAVSGERAPLALDDAHASMLRKMGYEPDGLGSFARAVNGARDRLADPLVQPRTADGTRVAFDPAERQALQGIGIEEWYLPRPDSPHADISAMVRASDTRANYYSSPYGVAKIVAIRGPGTPFDDRTVWDSVESAQTSFDDALKVIPADQQGPLRAMRDRTQAQVDLARTDLEAFVAANKARAGYAPDEPVLFLDPSASKAGLTAEQLAQRTAFAREIRGRLETTLRDSQGRWADVGKPLYDVEGLGARMSGTAGEVASIGERGLLGVSMGTVKSAASHTVQGAVIGTGLGVAIEAGRELVTDGSIDGKTLWNNTLGNVQDFLEPLAGGTAGALLGGAVARMLPGGAALHAGLQFLGGSLGASAGGGQLRKDPGRALAGAAGSTAGALLGGALLAPIPGGAFVGGLVGGMVGQVGGEWLYDKLKAPAPQVAARPQLRGVAI